MELLREFWEILVLAGGIIVYAIRLEGKLNMFGVEIDVLKKQRDEDRAAAQKSRDEVHSMLKDMSDKLDRLIERTLGK